VTNNFYLSTEYLTMLRVAAVALRPYPEARQAFARALRDFDATGAEVQEIEVPRGNGSDHERVIDG
jgi:Asp-tRNA(Asn)/Glu-tRNA(Gln) amidotransferase A subunit family amidase